jgi:hypothetical protein
MMLVAGSASAVTTYSFDFGGNAGTSTSGTGAQATGTTSVGGSFSFFDTTHTVSVTETAWWMSSAAITANGSFGAGGTASVGSYGAGYGLGVCNQSEITAAGGNLDCSTNSATNGAHQIDNVNGVDFILLKFSTPVSLAGLTSNLGLVHFSSVGTTPGNDADITWWTPASNITTSTTYSSLGTKTDVNTSSANCSDCLVTDTVSGSSLTNVTYLLIAASTSNTDATPDAFKLNALTVGAVGGGTQGVTPEPASKVMMGSGLLACAAMLRRRMSQK